LSALGRSPGPAVAVLSQPAS